METHINKQVLPQAPSPTMTSFLRISAMAIGVDEVVFGFLSEEWKGKTCYSGKGEADGGVVCGRRLGMEFGVEGLVLRPGVVDGKLLLLAAAFSACEDLSRPEAKRLGDARPARRWQLRLTSMLQGTCQIRNKTDCWRSDVDERRGQLRLLRLAGWLGRGRMWESEQQREQRRTTNKEGVWSECLYEGTYYPAGPALPGTKSKCVR